MELLLKAVADNGLVAAFAVVGILLWISSLASRHIFGGRIQGSAIAILGALALAYVGGAITGKGKGLSDLNGREFLMLSVLAVGVLLLGLWPAPLLDVMRGSIHHLVEQMLATKLPMP